MKKIFQNNRNEPNEVINTSNLTIGQNYSHFIGRTFQLDKEIVCVDDVIAEGGFSIVFLVKANSNGKKYALKRMYVNNEVDLEACKREIKIIKSLSEHNKNILKYIDSSIQRHSEDIYEILLLTKYCKHGGLVQLLNERIGSSNSNPNPHLKEEEILQILCDICEGLAELHKHKIIHRDLKIENILIDKCDLKESKKRNIPHQSIINYVLCDFGSATTKIFDRRLTNSAQQVQLVADEIQKYTTLSYRSPEMVDLYSDKLITTKSDIWALGCLLYKICYLQVPFGESQLAIQEGRYTIPDTKVHYFTKKLNALINYMLEPDPSKRPDIFQVSYLAFSLAQKQCPIQNAENSSIPASFAELSLPLTESEWRNLSQLKKQNQNNLNSVTQTETTTTVIPRERPKGNSQLSTVNNIILPLTAGGGSAALQNTPNKLNISRKPPTVVNPVQMKSLNNNPSFFDDDFASIPIPAQAQAQAQMQSQDNFSIHVQKNHSLIPQSTSSDFRHEQQLNSDIQQKPKTHRRSASHSSSIVQSSSNQIQANFNTKPQIKIVQHNPATEGQQQQFNNHQYQGHPPQGPHPPKRGEGDAGGSNLTPIYSNRLNLANHSRSASASPNVAVLKQAMALGTSSSSKGGVGPLNPNHQNPFNKNTTSNKNPFGDNFSMSNDNDIQFGLEFDRIREQTNEPLNNSNNKLNNENTQGDLLQFSSDTRSSGDKILGALLGSTTPESVYKNSNSSNHSSNHSNVDSNSFLKPPLGVGGYHRTHVKSISCSSINLNLLPNRTNTAINNSTNYQINTSSFYNPYSSSYVMTATANFNDLSRSGSSTNNVKNNHIKNDNFQTDNSQRKKDYSQNDLLITHL